MLLAGSGNSTCSPSADAGPPAFWGSRNFQLTEVPKAGDRAAAGRGIAMTSAVLASVMPDGRTRPAPAAVRPASAAHRPESGTQASAAARAGCLPGQLRRHRRPAARP